MRASASTVDAQNEITRIRRQSNTTRLEQQIFGDMRGLQRTDHKLFVTVCHRQRRRPIAKRITELSGHAAGLASPRSSLRATDRLWEAARCRRTSGRWRARLRLTAHAVRQPPGGWRSGGLAVCAGRVVMAGRAAAVRDLARRRRGRPRALAGRSTTRSLAGRPSSAARWSAAAQLVSESRPAARRQALDTGRPRGSCVAVSTS